MLGRWVCAHEPDTGTGTPEGSTVRRALELLTDTEDVKLAASLLGQAHALP
jgi:hypothetical protein